MRKTDNSSYNKLDLSKLKFSKKSSTTRDALKDVIPIDWSEDVLNGKKKVIIKKSKAIK